MNNIEIIIFEKVSIDYYHLLTYDKNAQIYNLCIMKMGEPQCSYDQNFQTAYGGLGATPMVCFNSYPTFNFSAEVMDAKVITFNTLDEYFDYMRNLHG